MTTDALSDIATEDLTRQEMATRIKAARMLRGISQDELAERFAAAGLPARVVGALERAEVDLRLAHRAALVNALGFPERWYIVPVDELCPEERDLDVIDRLDQIIALLAEG